MESVPTERLLSVTELATILNVEKGWVYDKVSSGEIPCLHVGRYPRFVLADVIAWLKTRRQARR